MTRKILNASSLFGLIFQVAQNSFLQPVSALFREHYIRDAAEYAHLRMACLAQSIRNVASDNGFRTSDVGHPALIVLSAPLAIEAVIEIDFGASILLREFSGFHRYCFSQTGAVLGTQ